MKIKNGRIAEATEQELYSYWLNRSLDDVLSFPDFLSANIRAGCKVKEDGA
jgi:hypothetical protein